MNFRHITRCFLVMYFNSNEIACYRVYVLILYKFIKNYAVFSGIITNVQNIVLRFILYQNFCTVAFKVQFLITTLTFNYYFKFIQF